MDYIFTYLNNFVILNKSIAYLEILRLGKRVVYQNNLCLPYFIAIIIINHLFTILYRNQIRQLRILRYKRKAKYTTYSTFSQTLFLHTFFFFLPNNYFCKF